MTPPQARLLEICTDYLLVFLLTATMFVLTTAEDCITTAHTRLVNYSPLDNTDKTTLILGALLLHAPSEVGQRNVAADILSSVNDAAMKALADLYLCGLLAPSESYPSHLCILLTL